MPDEPRSPSPDGAGAPSGLCKVFEGGVERAQIVHAELEGRGVPAFVTEPQVYTPNSELNGICGGAACVFAAADRRAEALRIVERAL
jgi:hypothetical protein